MTFSVRTVRIRGGKGPTDVKVVDSRTRRRILVDGRDGLMAYSFDAITGHWDADSVGPWGATSRRGVLSSAGLIRRLARAALSCYAHYSHYDDTPSPVMVV